MWWVLGMRDGHMVFWVCRVSDMQDHTGTSFMHAHISEARAAFNRILSTILACPHLIHTSIPHQVIADGPTPKMRFDLFLNISYSKLSTAPGGLDAFTADLRDAVALAFQVGEWAPLGAVMQITWGPPRKEYIHPFIHTPTCIFYPR